MVKAADGHFQMSGNLYFIFLILTIYFFFVKQNSKCAISDQICYKTVKNIRNKIYKFRRQSLTVYIPNDDRLWEYFENQGPDREGSFRSRESFRSLDRSLAYVSCSDPMTQVGGWLACDWQ